MNGVVTRQSLGLQPREGLDDRALGKRELFSTA